MEAARVPLVITPELHQRLVECARRERTSLNGLILGMLREALGDGGAAGSPVPRGDGPPSDVLSAAADTTKPEDEGILTAELRANSLSRLCYEAGPQSAFA